jgi:hypothetical protein
MFDDTKVRHSGWADVAESAEVVAGNGEWRVESCEQNGIESTRLNTLSLKGCT